MQTSTAPQSRFANSHFVLFVSVLHLFIGNEETTADFTNHPYAIMRRRWHVSFLLVINTTLEAWFVCRFTDSPWHYRCPHILTQCSIQRRLRRPVKPPSHEFCIELPSIHRSSPGASLSLPFFLPLLVYAPFSFLPSTFKLCETYGS